MNSCTIVGNLSSEPYIGENAKKGKFLFFFVHVDRFDGNKDAADEFNVTVMNDELIDALAPTLKKDDLVSVTGSVHLNLFRNKKTKATAARMSISAIAVENLTSGGPIAVDPNMYKPDRGRPKEDGEENPEAVVGKRTAKRGRKPAKEEAKPQESDSLFDD